MSTKRKMVAIVGASIAGGIVIGLVIASRLNFTPDGFANNGLKPVVVNTVATTAAIPSDFQETSRAFVDIAKRVTPTVVSITSEKVVKMKDPLSNFFHKDEFFRKFFNQPNGDGGREFKQRGLGSGVIVSSDGYILTNYHVVKEADEINVMIDKKPYDAQVVGVDPATDIAVVKIDQNNLPTVTVGDSDQLEVGEWVLAIGSPFDLSLQHTVTSGIISAKGRALNLSGDLTYQDFIQTDAAINPGNSGGALVNIRGELIGINTAIYAGNAGGNVGIGFAVPVNLAKHVMQDLIEHGEVVRGYLGVYIDNLDPELSEALKIDDNEGAVVTEVIEGTPAEKAGLKQYDVIVGVDGHKVAGRQALTNIVASYKPGKKVRLKVIRDGEAEFITVSLERRPESASAKSTPSQPEEMLKRLGLELRNLTDELASRFGYEGEEGVVVTKVESNSIAEEKGMRSGDLIVEVDRQPVRSVRQLREMFDGFGQGQIVLFEIRRGKGTQFIALKMP